jgi:hypothetical protein
MPSPFLLATLITPDYTAAASLSMFILAPLFFPLACRHQFR